MEGGGRPWIPVILYVHHITLQNVGYSPFEYTPFTRESFCDVTDMGVPLDLMETRLDSVESIITKSFFLFAIY